MEYNNEDDYTTPLNLYRKYRGFSTIQSLADAAGFSRQTMSLACSGERNMKPENLQKIADLLCVDPWDLKLDWTLEDPCQNVFDIPAALASIRKAISTCRTGSLKQKADRIVSYLKMENDSLETAMKFLLFHANDTAISILSYILGISAQDYPEPNEDLGEESDEESDEESEEPSIEGNTVLDNYRRQRGFTFTQLGSLSKIPRQTVSKLCKGTEQPNWNQLIALAQALHVDAVDLDRAPDFLPRAGEIVNISKETAKIEAAVARCKPTPLKNKINCVLAYLNNTNPELDAILSCLLEPSSSQQFEDILENTMVLCGIAQLYKNYDPIIQIGYSVSPEEKLVSAFVLFEPWIYELFRLKSPVCDLNVPIKDGFGRTITKGLDFPIIIDTSLSPQDDDFENLLMEQAEEYCIYQEADNVPKGLENIFCSYVSEYLWTAEISPYELKDLDLERPIRLEKRQKQYQTLLGHLMSKYQGSELIEQIASTFSHIKEDSEYEQKLFEELGMSDPV